MLEDVKVKEWMTTPVITVSPTTSINRAHELMKEHGVRRLPVVEKGALVGIITLGDVREASPSDATTLSIWELNYLWAQLIVEKCMTSAVTTIEQNSPILDAAQLMLDQKISGLPVLDDDGHLIGVITESDIFRLLVSSRLPQPVTE